jgi:hypothetical protein
MIQTIMKWSLTMMMQMKINGKGKDCIVNCFKVLTLKILKEFP